MSAAGAAKALQFGGFTLSVVERRLTLDGHPVALGSRAFDLLAALVARRERVVPKDELMQVVWPGLVVEDNNLQVQISALRKVLGAAAIATLPGRGYQFTVAAVTSPVPAAAPPAMPAAPATAAVQAPDGAASAHLLVADDNKVNRLLLCRSLELMGHHVRSVDDGRSALEHLLREPVDLLLLDLEMPELDGFALLERRATDPALREVPVIVTSSLEGVAQVARCIELGADDYLRKPVNAVLLKARVASSLERKRLRDRQRALLARTAAPAAGPAGAGCRCDATVLVARLGGVEALVASQPAADTLELLGGWATLMADAVESHGGRLSLLAGDALTAVFGLPDVPLAADAPWAAAQAATDMRELTAQFDAERRAAGGADLPLAIGLATGPVVAGPAGTLQHPVLACVGAAAQRADALAASAAQQGGGATWIDGATQARVAGQAPTEALRPMLLAGHHGPVPVHALRRG